MDSTFDEKKEYLNEHFRYEVTELLSELYFHTSLVKRIENGEYEAQQYMNMSIEHACLHVRNLDEFYYDGLKKGEYRAADYIPSWINTERSQYLESSKTRINNEIAHMGSKRYINPEDKQWDIPKLVWEILDVTSKFLNQLDENYYNMELKELKYTLKMIPRDQEVSQ